MTEEVEKLEIKNNDLQEMMKLEREEEKNILKWIFLMKNLKKK